MALLLVLAAGCKSAQSERHDSARVTAPDGSRYTAASAPGARLSVYPGIGHSPFWEDAERFNRELAEFARGAWRP